MNRTLARSLVGSVVVITWLLLTTAEAEPTGPRSIAPAKCQQLYDGRDTLDHGESQRLFAKSCRNWATQKMRKLEDITNRCERAHRWHGVYDNQSCAVQDGAWREFVTFMALLDSTPIDAGSHP